MYFQRSKSIIASLLMGAAGAVPAAPMSLDDYLALSGPAPTAHIAYGAAPSQFAELFLPAGPGPFPVVLLVHGGCWTVHFGGIKQMHNVAGELARQGIAVWNVEYRRVDEDGGGYPGMYLDMNAAIDKLEAESARYGLDTSRIVAVGHSAGGQLVQWIAGRPKLPTTSPLYRERFLPIRQIISLGGLADLRNKDWLKSSCERDVVQLTGVASTERPDVYADTNAAVLVPNGSRTVLINGEHDHVSPPRIASDYAAVVRAAGDHADTVVLPGAGHYDEVAASSPSWRLILPEIQRALGITSKP